MAARRDVGIGSEVGSGAQGSGLARDWVMVSEWEDTCRSRESPEEYKGEVSNRFVVKIKEVSRSFAGKEVHWRTLT